MLNNKNKHIKKIMDIFLILSLFMITMMGYIINDVKADEEVLYYKFTTENLDLTTIITHDYSEYNNDGIVYNIYEVNGIRNKGAFFNGDNSYIEVVNPSNLSFTDGVNDKPFSITVWLKNLNRNKEPVLIKGSNEAGSLEYLINIDSTSESLSFTLIDDGVGTLNIKTNESINNYSTYNSWRFITCVYNGIPNTNGLEIFVNGNIVNTTSTIGGGYIRMTPTNDTLYIGNAYITDNQYFTGSMSELRIYNYNLLDNEVKDIYNSYILKNYSIILLDEFGIIKKNISVYRDNEFINEVEYKDVIDIDDSYNYTFIIETDLSDKFTSIKNIDNVSKNSISPIVYIIIIILIIGFIKYIYKR